MGEAGQRYAKPDAMPAAALCAFALILICNHISHTDGRHVRKDETADVNISSVFTSLCSFHLISFVLSLFGLVLSQLRNRLLLVTMLVEILNTSYRKTKDLQIPVFDLFSKRTKSCGIFLSLLFK